MSIIEAMGHSKEAFNNGLIVISSPKREIKDLRTAFRAMKLLRKDINQRVQCSSKKEIEIVKALISCLHYFERFLEMEMRRVQFGVKISEKVLLTELEKAHEAGKLASKLFEEEHPREAACMNIGV